MTDKQDQPAKIILESLKTQAKKLALLLHASAMPADVKDALAVLLPQMTLEQIAKLLNILEAKYLDEQTKAVDEKYKKELGETVKSFEEKRERDKNKLLSQLNELARIYE